MSQPGSEQEKYVENNVQNDFKMPAPDVELNSTNVQPNKEIDHVPVQYTTEFQAVSIIYRHYLF